MKAIVTTPTRASTMEERRARLVYFHDACQDAKALGHELHLGPTQEAEIVLCYTDLGVNAETRYVTDAAISAGIPVEYRQIVGRKKKTGGTR